jgi:hypothetical protein
MGKPVLMQELTSAAISNQNSHSTFLLGNQECRQINQSSAQTPIVKFLFRSFNSFASLLLSGFLEELHVNAK